MVEQGPTADDVAAWRGPQTLQELGELTAQWLEGRIVYGGPHNGGHRPDAETGPLTADLCILNRGGYLTEFSQPGELDEAGWSQRAAVSGYCLEQTAESIAAACVTTDLICIVVWPGTTSVAHIPVSRDGATAQTWAGMSADPQELADGFAEHCSVMAMAELISACQVTVIDPIWGRNDLLWTVLRNAVSGSTRVGGLPQFE